MPWEDAQLVATQVASHKVRVWGWAIEHVAKHVMQIKLLVVVLPSTYTQGCQLPKAAQVGMAGLPHRAAKCSRLPQSATHEHSPEKPDQ